MKKSIVQVFAMGLIALLGLSACGESGGGKNTQDSTISQKPEENNNNTTLLYNYDADGTNSIVLSSQNVNKFEEISDSLARLQDDEEEFKNIINVYISELFDAYEPIDNLPVFAPRGASKSMIIDIENQAIDYSNYRLKGDLNNDYKVNFEDIALLKDAIFKKQISEEYDLNNDGKLDIKDVIYISSHLNAAVYFFDFYSLDGKKLPIATRDVKATKRIDYSGELTQVMLVPKDINHASGFVSGLNDIESVWYKKDLLKMTLTDSEEIEVDINSGLAIYRSVLNAKLNTNIKPLNVDADIYNSTNYPLYSSSTKINEKTLGNLIYNKMTADNYLNSAYHLLGWEDYISNVGVPLENLYVNHVNVEDFTLKNLTTLFYEYQISIHKSHFSELSLAPFNTHALSPSLTDFTYHFFIGVRGAYEIHYIPKVYTYNLEYTLKVVPTPEQPIMPDMKIYFSVTSLIETHLFMSNENNTIEGQIDNQNFEINGKVKAHRIGPDPQIKDFEADVVDGIYTFENFPYGVYKLDFENSCKCNIPLESEVLIDQNSLPDINLDIPVKNLILTIQDKIYTPIADANVELKPKECVGNKTDISYIDKSNSEGEVYFDDIPIGSYTLYVDGKKQKDLQVCEDINDRVVLSSLWSLKIDFVMPTLMSGSVTYKDFTLDCVNTLSSADALVASSTGAREIPACAYVNDESIDMRTDQLANVSYSGNMTADPYLGSDMTIATEGIVFEAYLPGVDWQISSIIWDGHYNHGSVDGCFGNFTSNTLSDINAGKKTSWSSMSKGDGTSYCDFVLEPCQNEACE